jgi:hypothetical protein
VPPSTATRLIAIIEHLPEVQAWLPTSPIANLLGLLLLQFFSAFALKSQS